MKLKVPVLDARTRRGRHPDRVIDLDTGKTIGFISGRHGSALDSFPSWVIQLFDAKYSAGFKSWEECAAFAKGVETVLNHMISVGEVETATDAA